MRERFKDWFDDKLDEFLNECDYFYAWLTKPTLGTDRFLTRMLYWYIVLFLLCLWLMVYVAHQATLHPIFDCEFWYHTIFSVGFGMLSIITYVATMFLSVCLTRAQERAWRECNYE